MTMQLKYNRRRWKNAVETRQTGGYATASVLGTECNWLPVAKVLNLQIWLKFKMSKNGKWSDQIYLSA